MSRGRMPQRSFVQQQLNTWRSVRVLAPRLNQQFPTLLNTRPLSFPCSMLKFSLE